MKEVERQQANMNYYISTISSVYSKWRASDVKVAEEELDTCRPEVRNWEWGYLKRLCHLDLETVRLDSDGVRHAAVSGDGRRIAIVGLKPNVVVFDATTGKRIADLGEHKQPPSALTISANGKLIACMDHEKTIRVWEVATGKTVAALPGHRDEGRSMAFSPDGKRIAVGGSKAVRIWLLSTAQVVRALKTDGRSAVLFSPDGKHLAAASGNAVKVWDIEQKINLLTVGQARLCIRCLAFSRDGKLLAAGSGETLSARGRARRERTSRKSGTQETGRKWSICRDTRRGLLPLLSATTESRWSREVPIVPSVCGT